MSGFGVLDVAIGLSFVYLLLALVCTAVNELIAGLLGRRSANLKVGLQNLLIGSAPTKAATPDGQPSLIDKFYNHPLIKALYENKRRPAYVPPRIFTLALIDMLAGPDAARKVGALAPVAKQATTPPIVGNPGVPPAIVPAATVGSAGDPAAAVVQAINANIAGDPHLAGSLGLLLADAGDDVEKMRKNIEQWFDDTMDRVSGWYKQKTQWITLLIAMVTVGIVNADTIRITRSLSTSPTLRETVVANARDYTTAKEGSVSSGQGSSVKPADKEGSVPSGQGSTAKPVDKGSSTSSEQKSPARQIADDIGQLNQLGIPLGWNGMPKCWLSTIVGLLITAVAVSLGAPFWFDTLNRIITIRGAGKSPREAKQEPETPKPKPA
jgi:hypothetical protein